MTNFQFDEYNNILALCLLFKNMDIEEIKALPLITDGNMLTCSDGDVLNSSYLYIVLKGSICVEKCSSDGRMVNMTSAGPAAAVNAASVLAGKNDMSRLSAVGRCTCLQIGEKALRKSLALGGTFSINFTEFLTDRICFLNEKIASFTGYTAESRLTMYLKEHASASADSEKTGTSPHILLPPLKTLAETLGVGRASLYRALDSMEENGSIKRDGRAITLLK